MGRADAAGASELQRFVVAQDADGTFVRALEELRSGRKRTHWMWFVFPQLAGLGNSPTAVRFALGSLDAAAAYVRHPVLGDRLRAATDALLDLDPGAGTADDILGTVDAMKLRSSATLFARADTDDARYRRILDRYFDGLPDPRTEELLGPGD